MVRSHYSGIGISRLDCVVIYFPCRIEVIAAVYIGGSAFVYGNVLKHGIDFGEFAAHFIFPCRDLRADNFRQHLTVVVRICGYAENSVIIGVIHLYLTAARFKKFLRHVQSVAVGVFRTQSALCSQHLGLEGRKRIHVGNALVAYSVKEARRSVDNVVSFLSHVYCESGKCFIRTLRRHTEARGRCHNQCRNRRRGFKHKPFH